MVSVETNTSSAASVQTVPVPLIPSMEGMTPNFAAAERVAAATSSPEPATLDNEVHGIVTAPVSINEKPVSKKLMLDPVTVAPVSSTVSVSDAVAPVPILRPETASVSSTQPFYMGTGEKIGNVVSRSGETKPVHDTFVLIPYSNPGETAKSVVLYGDATRWFTRFYKSMEGLLKQTDGTYNVVTAAVGHAAIKDNTSEEFLLLHGHYKDGYPRLKKEDGSKQPGWGFSIDQKDLVLMYIDLFVKGTLPPRQWVKKQRSQKKQNKEEAPPSSPRKSYAQKAMQAATSSSSSGRTTGKGGRYEVKVFWPRPGQTCHITIGKGTLVYKVRTIDQQRGEVQIHQLGSTELSVLNHTTFSCWQVRGVMDDHKVRFL